MNDYYVFALRRIDFNKIISVKVGCNYNYHHFNYAFSNRYFYSNFSFSEFLSLKEQNLIKTEIIKVNLSKEKANSLKRLIITTYNLPKKPCSRSKSILPRKTPSEFDHSQNASKPEFDHNLKSLKVLNQVLNSNFSNQDEFLQIFDQELKDYKYN